MIEKKKKTFRESESNQTKGKRKFRERLVEEEEAEKEIDLFKKRPKKDYEHNIDIQNFDIPT